LTLQLVCNVAPVVEHDPANVGDTITIRCRFMGYWAWARVSGRGDTSSLLIVNDRLAVAGLAASVAA